MEMTAIRSNIKGKELEDALVGIDAVVIDPNLVKSIEEIKLAEYLAKKSFENKNNIAKRLKYEFLLWVTGKTDLKSAFKIANPKNKDMILIVFSGDKKRIIEKLKAKTQDSKLKTRLADPLDIERISLSRIKN
jgi:tRNA threonylcarbamoyladenosine modification (KEOPS) complex Cgi121 subunit